MQEEKYLSLPLTEDQKKGKGEKIKNIFGEGSTVKLNCIIWNNEIRELNKVTH